MVVCLRGRFGIAIVVALSCSASTARASFDEFDDGFSPKHFELHAKGLTLTLKGEIELELHDLEGRGGTGYDSPTDTRTLGTRSPFVEIDSFWLALRLGLSAQLAVNTLLEFDPSGARVAAVFFDARFRWPEALEHHVEIGLHTPLVKIDRRSERYPLIATIYWREAEAHAVYELTLSLSSQTSVELGLSLAMMRPIAFSSVAESSQHRGTINVVAYGPARPFSGNAPVAGGRLRVSSHGAHLDVFGFAGSLAAEAGTDELRNSFANYRDLPGFNDTDLQQQPRRFFWYGGRLGYDGYGVHALVEAIASGESLLSRIGAYGQLSYALALRSPELLFHRFELLGRYEIYRILGATTVHRSGRALRSVAPSQAVTWDFDVITAALICTIHAELLRARVEYYWISEHNGIPALGISDSPLRNNELLLQLELRF